MYPMRVKAGQKEAAHIDQPHLTLFGTATPQYFYESLSQRMLTNGFFARLMIVDVGKRGPGHIFLVTDAMATFGTSLDRFSLNGRTVYRRDGRLRLADGTLAGADIDMLSAMRFMHDSVGVPLAEVLRMASRYPAEAVGMGAELGLFAPGARASAVHMSEALEIARVWVDGRSAGTA